MNPASALPQLYSLVELGGYEYLSKNNVGPGAKSPSSSSAQPRQQPRGRSDTHGEGGFVGVEVRGVQGLVVGAGAAGAQEEVKARDFPGVEGEVLAAQNRAHLNQRLGAEARVQNLQSLLGQVGVVKEDGVQGLAFQAVSGAAAGADPFQEAVGLVQEGFPDLGVVVAQGAFQDHLVGQNIEPGAPGNGAEGQDRGSPGVFALGEHGLQQGEGLGRHHDGVHPMVGRGRVGLAAADLQPELIGPGHDDAGAVAELAHRQPGGDVEPGDGVHLVQHAQLHHQLGAAHRARRQAFFRGLEDNAAAAGQFVFQFAEQLGHTQSDANVHVVAAGVHHSRRLGAPGSVRPLLDGQGVQVGPPGIGPAGPGTNQVRHHAVPGHSGSDLQPQPGQILGRHLAGAGLLVGEFRVLVKIPSQVLEFREEGLGPPGNTVLEVGSVGHGKSLCMLRIFYQYDKRCI